MKIIEFIALGLFQLQTNALRSLLTILGIMIGVGAVVGVVSIGEGLHRTVIAQFAQVGGANLIIVQPPLPWVIKDGRRMRRTWREYLTEKDLEAIKGATGKAEAAYPLVGWNARVRYHKASTTGEIQGTLPGYHHAMDWELDRGRFISNWDVREWRRVCVIGDKVATDLFGKLEALGREIKLNGERYAVIGVMKPRILFGQDWGYQIVVPVTTIQNRIVGKDHYDLLFVYAKDTADIGELTADIRRVLRRLHQHGDEFRIESGEAMLATIDRIILILEFVVGGIASISLLVGGIGIMNIMLVSVTERTREIGIRKAVGAKQRHILAQFLVESVILSLFGGILGILCGLAIGYGVSALIEHFSMMSFPGVVSSGSIALSIFFSGGVGVFFGVYPAARASRLDPVEALRYA